MSGKFQTIRRDTPYFLPPPPQDWPPICQWNLKQWRHFEKHLEQLKKALGPVMELHPID